MSMSKKLMFAALGLTVALGAAAMVPSDASARGFFRGGGGGKMLANAGGAGLAAVRGGGRRELLRPPVKQIAELKSVGRKRIVQDIADLKPAKGKLARERIKEIKEGGKVVAPSEGLRRVTGRSRI